MSLPEYSLRHSGRGRVLRLSPRSKCLFQNIAFEIRAAAEYLELSTRPVCLLQTVGEPSVLSARSLRTYVPLRAKPKRKRVCKKYTGLKPHGCGPDTLKRVCKRYTGLKPKVCGPGNGSVSARDIPVSSPMAAVRTLSSVSARDTPVSSRKSAVPPMGIFFCHFSVTFT